MYTSFFGLNEEPFSITPNPRYLYMSERHTEALAHLIYGIKDSGGFVQLTGEVGTGKTTLIRSLLQRLPGNADVALILNPQLSATEFLAAILEELGVPQPGNLNSLQALTYALNGFLLKNHSQGRRTILIVDEAQNFAIDVLEQIRLLTNLETARQKLLQITLIGQPELRTLLARTDLRQLAQRITGRYHLEPLSQADTEEYIHHRLRVAGSNKNIFPANTCRELYRLSGGVPRIINVIADRAMLGAYTQDEHEINTRLVRQAAGEVFGEDPDLRRNKNSWLYVAAFTALAILLIGTASFTALRFISANTQGPAVAATEPVTESPTTLPVIENTDIAPELASLEELIVANTSITDTRNAFVNLFTLWGITFDSESSLACEQAQQHQLFCLFQRGSLAQIQQLNRPVILTLQDSTGTKHEVVLATLSASSAGVRLGNTTYEVPISDINALWYGEYLLLWKPQIGIIKSFYPGMRDPDVPWIRKSLAKIQGETINPINSILFDETLEAHVRDYQVTRRLNVDGLVGQQTQIVINSDLGVSAPRLIRAN
ncbi:MAG: AAA family ATPase [Gammaproteobacteria bacterium]|nr:AAA family ATPase [Gammaproteobacteria bacterium]MCP4929719.1 AAA family ATPase [Gammaproteobacteria bacterium]